MADIFNMTDTWNNGATVFTSVKMNVTDTASDAASKLIDVQVGAVSKFNITKAGSGYVGGNFSVDGVNGGLGVLNSGTEPASNRGFLVTNFGGASLVTMGSAWRLGWESSASVTTLVDLVLQRDAANTLAQRNGTNAQAFNLYNTYTDASNYERGFMRWTANVLQIGHDNAGTGSARNILLGYPGFARILINPANTVSLFPGTDNTGFSVNNVALARVSSSGQFCFTNSATDATATTDTGLSRHAAGILRVTNGSTGAGVIQTPALTVATLPAAATAGAGARSFVTDANATTFNSTVAAGGANAVPVFSDGTNWKIG